MSQFQKSCDPIWEDRNSSIHFYGSCLFFFLFSLANRATSKITTKAERNGIRIAISVSTTLATFSPVAIAGLPNPKVKVELKPLGCHSG